MSTEEDATDAQPGIDPYATTPGGLTFPVLSDAPNVPYDMQQLALSVDAKKVAKAGDTMTGNLTLSKATPVVNMNDSGGTTPGYLAFQRVGVNRWLIQPAGAETGSDTGTDLTIKARHDDGSAGVQALTVSRATGLGTVAGDPTAALGIATKQSVDKRYVIGRTTAANIASGPASTTGPTITFPVGKFTTAPSVQLGVLNFGGVVVCQITSTTKDVFQTILRLIEPTGSSSTVINWAAWSMDLSPTALSLDVPEPPPTAYNATCRTGGCHNLDTPIGVPEAPIEGGELDVVCGACGQRIPDVVPL